MGAVSDFGDVFIRAVNAGNDMLIVSDFDAAVTEIVNGVENGVIDETLIDQAVERILKAKEECGIIDK